MTLPLWYKGWLLANPKRDEFGIDVGDMMDQRSPEYLFKAM